MSLVTKRCETCVYYSVHGAGSCDYIGVMHERRPCPAGDKCTVYQQGDHDRRQVGICVKNVMPDLWKEELNIV